MEDKDAIEILTKMLEKKSLSEKEKEAVLTAIGILSWSKLGQGRLKQIAKAHKAKLEYNLKGRDTKQFKE
jgi:hypothetical protein